MDRLELPPTQDASHHQDYSIFSRESKKICICDCYWDDIGMITVDFLSPKLFVGDEGCVETKNLENALW